MSKIKFVSLFVSLVLSLSAGTFPGEVFRAGIAGESSSWLTYTDPRYGFSIEYPADWAVIPRDDTLGVGATLVFSNVDPQTMPTTTGCCAYSPSPSPIKVEIGMYLVELPAGESLDAWTTRYNEVSSVFEPTEIDIKSVRNVWAGGQDALREEGLSPLTEFKYVNVPWGRTVWFIWTNSDDAHVAIYDHMVASFKFGDNTPETLQEAYGEDFRPFSLDGESLKKASASGRVPRLAKSLMAPDSTMLSAPLSAPSGYRVPVDDYHPILCGDANASICGGTHRGTASQAIDISMSAGTSVKNSASGYWVFAGWNTQGYGNLALILDWTHWYTAYYAHLSALRNTSAYPVLQGTEIGLSGDSGCPGAYHLHFHVKNSAGGIDLHGMPHLTLYNSYPNCGYTTCPGFFECQCGRVY